MWAAVTHLNQLGFSGCKKFLLKLPVLGKLVPNSHFHLQLDTVSLGTVQTGSTRRTAFIL